MYSEQEKKTIKDKILAKIAETKTDIQRLEEQTKPIAPDNAIGRISRIDAINNRSVSEAMLRQAKSNLIKLEYAASCVDKDSFGVCVRCGNNIPLGRLMLVPESTKCTHCS